MKKLALFAVAMMVCATAFAQVRVTQNGTVTNYAKGATITIPSADSAEVYYDGVLITVPKGKKVVISQNRDGKVIVSGYSLDGLKIMGQEVKANNASVYVINPITKTVVKEPASQYPTLNNQQSSSATNNTQTTNPQSTQSGNQSSQGNDSFETVFPEVDQYVNEIASQQAVENVEEQLSPSAPR